MDGQCPGSAWSAAKAAKMVKHNNVLPNGHFHKKWQRRVRTWFDQVSDLSGFVHRLAADAPRRSKVYDSNTTRTGEEASHDFGCGWDARLLHVMCPGLPLEMSYGAGSSLSKGGCLEVRGASDWLSRTTHFYTCSVHLIVGKSR